MRLHGKLKNGFFPIPAEAIEAIGDHLTVRGDPSNIRIIDPCAGAGEALVSLGKQLGVPKKNLYAVELNMLRAGRIAEEHPEVRLLGPCAFGSAVITRESFSLVYCNPPFDDEYGGGGREELSFLRRCHGLLPPGGILVFVCPADQVYGSREMCTFLDTWFDQVQVYKYPATCRNYREVIVFGVHRKTPREEAHHYVGATITAQGLKSWYGWKDEPPFPQVGENYYLLSTDKYGSSYGTTPRSEEKTFYPLPETLGPRRFEKVMMTQEEIARELSSSPLYDLVRVRPDLGFRSPPLSLGKGHTSLLLLSGLLDGFVPSDPPHVVRGHTRKDESHKRTEQHETAAGTLVTKKTYSESPTPLIRAVWADGVIRTFGEPVQAESVNVDSEDLEIDEDI